MSFGQETSSQTANKLRSTFVYGNLGNFDKSDGAPTNLFSNEIFSLEATLLSELKPLILREMR